MTSAHRLGVGGLVAVSLALGSGGCGTIELGENIIPPNIRVDEDRFYCEVAPDILVAHSCATGGTAACPDTNCHGSTSSFRLSRTITLPTCSDGVPSGPIDPALHDDFNAVSLFLGSDAMSSPFWRRPVGADTHPCVVFPASSAESDLIASWIEGEP